MLKPPQCRGCPLFSRSDGFSIPDGKGTNGVIIVGEALGYEEYLDGMPFRPRASSGSKLEESFQLNGYHRESFLLYNTIQCHPVHDNIDTREAREAISFCKVHRDRVIGGFVTPFTKTLLGLGQTPLMALAGVSGEAKNKESITHLRGYVFPTLYGPMVASLHPSYLRRGKPALTPFLVTDIHKAVSIANGTYTTYKGGPDFVEPIYQTHPSLDAAWSFYNQVKDNPNRLLTYDIETPMFADMEEDERDTQGPVTPTLIQFSLGKGTGIAFPYFDKYIEIAKMIMALPNIKANHNTWDFDNPILRDNGFRIEGKIHDTMWMFKTWHPGLERGLQKAVSLFDFPFPWKHLYGAQLEYYGCADVDAVQYIMASLPKLMAKDGTWACYKSHVFDLFSGPLSRASRIGIPVSPVKWKALYDSIQARVTAMDTEIQGMIPTCLKNCTPPNGYVKEPKEITQIRSIYITKAQESLSNGIRPKNTFREVVFKLLGMELRHFDYIARKKVKGKEDSLLEGVEDEESEEVEETHIVADRWCKIVPFTASSVQVIKYLEWKQTQLSTKREKNDYAVPMTTKKRGTDPRATTGKEELQYIVEKTNDPILSNVIEMRSLSKMLTNDLPNWKPSYDGRVHTTWGFKAPTGQLDSTKPNIQNCAKHTDLGQEFRGIIEAEPGYEFSEIDYKTFHVAIMGYVANDPSYIRYSQMDPHSIFASHIINDPSIPKVDLQGMTKEQIREITSRIKKEYPEVRQHTAKPVVLGNQLGLGPLRLYVQNRKYIGGLNHAKELQGILARLFPLVEKAKEFIRELAHRQKYLRNEWGRKQDFYEVFNYVWDKRMGGWQKKGGSDSEKALAFAVQSVAFGMIAEVILTCEKLGLNSKFNWVNTIHDSSMFYHRIEQRQEFIGSVIPLYKAPCSFLKAPACPNGLSVDVDYSVGLNWKSYNEESNPGGMKEI
jgi:uracil-DNA glycosylase family 4